MSSGVTVTFYVASAGDVTIMGIYFLNNPESWSLADAFS